MISILGVEEEITLGGFLTTLAEAELICDLSAGEKFRLLVPSYVVQRLSAELIDDIVSNTLKGRWEQVSLLGLTDFSIKIPQRRKLCAHDTTGLAWISQRTGLLPTITWNQVLIDHLELTAQIKLKKSVVVHLRNSPEGDDALSSAAGEVWSEAIAQICSESDSPILLVGDDQRPVGFSLPRSVRVADLSGMPLSTQLSAAASANVFLGMASGIANAALFSSTPVVLFKSHMHHVDEMLSEFGDLDRIAFWRPGQVLIRRQPTAFEIVEEWRHVKDLS